MISSIKKFFENNLHLDINSSSADKTMKLPLATAALMYELMKTDTHIDQRETEALLQVLQRTFVLDAEKLQEIVALAEAESRKSTSLYEFTNLINSEYSYEERVQLVENLWLLAFADQHLDRYEDHMIRKIADLIYVRHSDFIRTKLDVKARLGTHKADSAQ